jgi:hypothetical protein
MIPKNIPIDRNEAEWVSGIKLLSDRADKSADANLMCKKRACRPFGFTLNS